MKKIFKAFSLLLFAAMLMSISSLYTAAQDSEDPFYAIQDPFENFPELEEPALPTGGELYADISPDFDGEIAFFAANLSTTGFCGGEGNGKNLTWVLDGGVLIISGTGAMKNRPVFGDPAAVTSVVIEYGVTSIGDWAFRNYTALDSVIIPESVTSIGQSAFSGCRGLSSINLPGSLKAIGKWGFKDCYKLGSINLPTGLNAIEDYTFQNCASLKSIVIPGNIKTIGNWAFSGCSNLSDVDIQPGVQNILSSAFEKCTLLSSITLPSTLTGIGGYAFSNCRSLKTVEIPASVVSIGNSAFYYCDRLSAISVDGANTAFCSEDGVLFSKEKTELICCPAGRMGTSYSIPEGTKTVGVGAFSLCFRLTTLKIPASVTSIENYAFFYCAALTAFTADSGNQSFAAADGVLFSKDMTKIISCPIGKASSSYSIPDTVLEIGSYAFSGCTGLTSVDIPAGVKDIGDYAFASCVGLSKVNIPAGVGAIGNYAFSGCSGLFSAAIPDTVTKIGRYAFSGCGQLSYIIIPKSVTVLGDCAFSGMPSGSDIYCEAAVKPQGWSQNCFTGCQAAVTWDYKGDSPVLIIATGSCGGEGDGSNLSWSLTKSGVLTISGSGAMFSRISAGAPWQEHIKSIRHIVIDEGVTTIGEGAFWSCPGLSSVTIPKSVRMIKNNPFAYCNSLTSIAVDSASQYYCVTDGVLYSKDMTRLVSYPCAKRSSAYSIPKTVKTIDGNAFGGCVNLASVSIPNGVETIGNSAFYGSLKLSAVKIPATVTSIGSRAFASCYKLASITVDSGNTSYCSSAGVLFNREMTEIVCYPVKKAGDVYTVPNGVGKISDNAFSGCADLKGVIIPKSVKEIGWSAFTGCEGLRSMLIPETVSAMGFSVFDRCIALTDIYCEAAAIPTGWNRNWLGDCSAKVHPGFKQIYGDFNGDGKVSDSELAVLLDIVKGMTSPTASQIIAADYNGDGMIDIRDFNYIYNFTFAE